MNEAPELRLVDVVECPVCGSYYEEDGPEGILPHAFAEHPDSPWVELVDDALLGLLRRDVRIEGPDGAVLSTENDPAAASVEESENLS